jgi:uncharacterized protein (DUF1697 family)
MPLFVGFLRGINVGGNNLLPMSALKAACESAGLTDVRTFLQSGNVIFRSTKKDPAPLIRKALDLDVKVMVRTVDELQDVIARNPFGSDRNPKRLIVTFLDGTPSKDAQAALLAAHKGPEEIHFSGRELFIYYGEDMGRSKLTNALIEKKLGMSGTARNWNTVTKMLTQSRTAPARPA